MCSNDLAVIKIEDNEFDNTGDGIWIWPTTNAFSVSITGNDIHDCSKNGVKLVGGCVGDVLINCNNIYNNLQGVNGCVDPVDATFNWWGCSGGPGDTGCDTVSVNVDFDPWLDDVVSDPCPPPPAPAYNCVGFEPPMDKPVSAKKKNRVLPLKMVCTDEYGAEVTHLDCPPVVEVDFNATPGWIPTDETALPAGQGDEGNQFVYSGNYWQFNLQTKNFSASGVYTIRAVSGDPGTYVINPYPETTFEIE